MGNFKDYVKYTINTSHT